jgi:hypothetical protein
MRATHPPHYAPTRPRVSRKRLIQTRYNTHTEHRNLRADLSTERHFCVRGGDLSRHSVRVHRRDDPFDVEAFLARPLTARLAALGPSVRPVWYLWEDSAFWVLTGSWSRMPSLIERDARVALVIDTCDLRNGEVLQVVATGNAELLPYDGDRGFRKLSRYLGDDETTWDDRFRRYLRGVSEAQWLRLPPTRLRATDLSFQPPSGEGAAL